MIELWWPQGNFLKDERRSKHLLIGAENSQEALFNKDEGEGTWIGPMNETLTINTCKMPTKLFGQFYPEHNNTSKKKMGEIDDHLKMNWDDYICRQICFRNPEWMIYPWLRSIYWAQFPGNVTSMNHIVRVAQSTWHKGFDDQDLPCPRQWCTQHWHEKDDGNYFC